MQRDSRAYLWDIDRAADDALPVLRSTIAILIKELGGWKE